MCRSEVELRMPFSKDVKAQIFVRSARICCLCYKQCGTNIEAAHIIDESKGGSNTADNAIPVCFDCHQEIGAYSNEHPRGNRFTPTELKARRDQLYSLVETGVIQAQIVADQVHMASAQLHLTGLPAAEVQKVLPTTAREASKEGGAVLDQILKEQLSTEALSYKLGLLNEADRAFILDTLIERFEDSKALTSLMEVLESGHFEASAVLIIEQVLRKVTLLGDSKSKAHFMKSVPINILEQTDPGLRAALFVDVIHIMNRDQFSEVNLVTPAVARIQVCLPQELESAYLAALLSQAKSGAYQGAPAAGEALRKLAEDAALKALDMLDLTALINSDSKHIRSFLEQRRPIWPSDRQSIFEDYINLKSVEFFNKYYNIHHKLEDD
jgi:hypothetical protein